MVQTNKLSKGITDSEYDFLMHKTRIADALTVVEYADMEDEDKEPIRDALCSYSRLLDEVRLSPLC